MKSSLIEYFPEICQQLLLQVGNVTGEMDNFRNIKIHSYSYQSSSTDRFIVYRERSRLSSIIRHTFSVTKWLKMQMLVLLEYIILEIHVSFTSMNNDVI